jgi:hypothetical protein
MSAGLRRKAVCGSGCAETAALPIVKADTDIVTSEPRGAGVVAVVRCIIEDDFAELAPSIERQTCEIAYNLEGRPVRLHPHCGGAADRGLPERRQGDYSDRARREDCCSRAWTFKRSGSTARPISVQAESTIAMVPCEMALRCNTVQT